MANSKNVTEMLMITKNQYGSVSK
nr:unnamed protein product [Callosobruchus analis]